MSQVDSTLRKIRDAKEFAERKIKSAKTIEEREDAEDLKYYLDGLVKQMCEYTDTVFLDNSKNAKRVQLMKEMDGQDFRSYCEGIERTRKVSHDGLITQVRMTDALCEELGIDPIYGRLPEKYKRDTSGLMGEKNRANEGVVETRHAIADWAWDVVLGSTVEMYIDMASLDYDHNQDDMATISQIYNSKIGKRKAKEMIDDLTSTERQ